MKKKVAESTNIVNVQNAEGDGNTTAEIVIRAKLDYAPKISVVIPVYNVEAYLHQCLDSVANQTLREIEIICVDDGSTDSSLEILKDYAASEKRLTMLKQQNLHAGVARNAGMAIAQGEYISFLDSDDYFEPNMLEKMYKKAQKTKAEIVICNADKFDDATKAHSHLGAIDNTLISKEVFCLSDIKNKVYFVTQPATWNKLYKASFLKKYPFRYQNLRSCNDFGFSYAVLSLAERICIIPDILVHYRKSTNTSITCNRSKTAHNIIYAYQYVRNILKKYNKDFLLPHLDDRLIAAIKYEGSLCSNEDAQIFKQQAMQILGEDYPKFAQYMPVEKIPVVVAADNNYAETLAVCLYSILQNTSSYIDFFIFSDGITDENIEKVKASIRNFNNFDIDFISMDRFNLQQFPHITRFTVSTFSRYFIPDICKQYDKVIYTDADVVFTGDIKSYYEIDLEDKGLAAVPEELGRLREGQINHEYRKNLFGIPASHQYFAAGNIIISCKYWREHNITEKLVAKTIELKDKLIYPDLDVLNIIFQNNYKRLHFKYCVTVHRYTEIDGNQEMIEGYRNPFIIHYSGTKKPWKTNKVLFFNEYHDIYLKTEFYKGKISMAKAPKKAPKNQLSLKLFNFLPLYTYKKRNGNSVWKILGLPVLRVRRFENNITTKCYLLGIPFLKISHK